MMEMEWVIDVLVLVFNALGACWMVELAWKTA